MAIVESWRRRFIIAIGLGSLRLIAPVSSDLGRVGVNLRAKVAKDNQGFGFTRVFKADAGFGRVFRAEIFVLRKFGEAN